MDTGTAVLCPLRPIDFQIDGPAIVKVERGANAAVANGGLADVRATPSSPFEVKCFHGAVLLSVDSRLLLL